MANSERRGTRLTAIIGLAVLFALLLLQGNRFGERFLHMAPLASRDLFWWPLFFIVLLYVVLVERRPLTSIGLRLPRWTTLAFAAGAAVVIHYGTDPLSNLITERLHLESGASAGNAIANTPLWYQVVLVTRAAFAEEVIFRGYMIERIEQVTGNRILAALLSLAAFTGAHLAYWGWAPLIAVASAGLVLTLLYLWRRDLSANILTHWLVDALPQFGIL